MILMSYSIQRDKEIEKEVLFYISVCLEGHALG